MTGRDERAHPSFWKEYGDCGVFHTLTLQW